jgi:hypothetical protein
MRQRMLAKEKRSCGGEAAAFGDLPAAQARDQAAESRASGFPLGELSAGLGYNRANLNRSGRGEAVASNALSPGEWTTCSHPSLTHPLPS